MAKILANVNFVMMAGPEDFLYGHGRASFVWIMHSALVNTIYSDSSDGYLSILSFAEATPSPSFWLAHVTYIQATNNLFFFFSSDQWWQFKLDRCMGKEVGFHLCFGVTIMNSPSIAF